MERTSIHKRFKQRGFSLVELVVVIAIIAIGLSLATVNFNQWQNKGKAEEQIRQLAADISELRIRAMTKKQPQSITLNASNYVLKAYTSVFAPYTSVNQQKVIPAGTRTVKYQLVNSSNVAFSNSVYEFDERGTIVGLPFSIFLSGTAAANGSIDCLTVHYVRINVGKNNAGVCYDR